MTGPICPVTPSSSEIQPASGQEVGGPVLYTVQEVAGMFRRTDRTIRNWMRAGLIRPTRLGRSVFFAGSEIERLTSCAPHIIDQNSET